MQPPHFDVVTSLAMLGHGSWLVSGSCDKNLRLYDLLLEVEEKLQETQSISLQLLKRCQMKDE